MQQSHAENETFTTHVLNTNNASDFMPNHSEFSSVTDPEEEDDDIEDDDLEDDDEDLEADESVIGEETDEIDPDDADLIGEDELLTDDDDDAEADEEL